MVANAGVHHAGVGGGHAHTCGLEFGAQRLKKTGHRKFAGAVSRAARYAHQSCQRGHGNDGAFAGLELRQRSMGAPHAAPEVDAHQLFVPAQVFGTDILKQGMGRNTGVVDQCIEPTKLLPGGGNQCAALGFVAHIGGLHQHLCAHSAALLGDSLQIGFAAGRQRELKLTFMGMRQLASHFGANAIGCASDDDAGHETSWPCHPGGLP